MATNQNIVASLPESLSNVQGTTSTLVLSVPASAPIGTLATSNVSFYPYGLSNSPVSVVPSTECWRLEDVVIYSVLTPDISLGIVVNGQNQPLSIDLNTCVISGSSSRLKALQPYMDIVANSTFNFTAYLQVANGSTAQTINVSVKMSRIPLSIYLGGSSQGSGLMSSLQNFFKL